MGKKGLDSRSENKDGTIRKKNGTTKNKNLRRPIEGFSPETTLTQMKKATGATSEDGVRRAMAKKKR